MTCILQAVGQLHTWQKLPLESVNWQSLAPDNIGALTNMISKPPSISPQPLTLAQMAVTADPLPAPTYISTAANEDDDDDEEEEEGEEIRAATETPIGKN